MIAPTEAQIEEVAKQIYKAMRFERLDSTPEWDDLGNSPAQSEARFTARAVVNGWGRADPPPRQRRSQGRWGSWWSS